jgi:tetratricopeptide (TPR) repeat protein
VLKLLTSSKTGLFSLIVVLLLSSVGCSVKKNNILSREFHKTVAHYNGYFNARERVKEGAKTLATSQIDRYDRILSIFKFGNPTLAKSIYPDMDEAIKKVSVVIQRHSMDIEGKERNKWIPQCYLVIGIAQFYKHDTWTAIESFQYVAAQYRTEPVRYEALLWLTQCYLRLGKMPDAEYLLNTMRDDAKMPPKLKVYFNAIFADYYFLQNDYEQSAEFLEKAAATTKVRADRIRYTFILGQIYQKMGEYPRAVAKYQIVMKSNPPYEMAFNAKVNRAMVIDLNSADGKEVKKMLGKMLKDEKNVEYRDQIYYALAEISLKEENKPEAIDNLKMSTAVSVANTNQKALSYLKLAEIYFKQPDYKLAQNYYDSTASFISEDHPDYFNIINTKNNLTKLIKNLNIIQVEDSLQGLAGKTAAERQMIIDQLVQAEDREKLKQIELKKEKDLLDKAQKEEMAGNQFNSLDGNKPPSNNSTSTGWYFSNQSAVSFGFNEFIKLWGNRKLEDNWRRSNRSTFAEVNNGEEADGIEIDSAAMANDAVRDSIMALNSAKRKKAYNEAIPLTAEQKAKSDEKIVEAYYNVGLIYKEQLKDNKEASANFETLMKRYPENQYKLPTYYNLYRVNLSMNNEEKANYYKNLILDGYPETEYAKIILNPDYYKDQQKKVAIQKVFYENTYRAYLNKQYDDVIERKSMADSLFPGSELAPKFELLKSLAIGKSKTIPEFEASLKTVVRLYPNDSVSVKAKEILALINPEMYSRKDSVTKQPGTSTEVIAPPKASTPFVFKADTIQYILLIYPNNNIIGTNALKVALSNYNTKYYSIKNLQISNSFLGTENQFTMIRPFTNKEDALQYLDGLLSDPEALQEVDVNIIKPITITPDNLLLLMQSRDLSGYEQFYDTHYMQ